MPGQAARTPDQRRRRARLARSRVPAPCYRAAPPGSARTGRNSGSGRTI